MALPGETEAGSAGKQPCRGIARRAHRDDDHGRGSPLSRSSPNPIGSIDPDALKIPARRAASTLTRSVRSPVLAEPAQGRVPSRPSSQLRREQIRWGLRSSHGRRRLCLFQQSSDRGPRRLGFWSRPATATIAVRTCQPDGQQRIIGTRIPPSYIHPLHGSANLLDMSKVSVKSLSASVSYS